VPGPELESALVMALALELELEPEPVLVLALGPGLALGLEPVPMLEREPPWRMLPLAALPAMRVPAMLLLIA